MGAVEYAHTKGAQKATLLNFHGNGTHTFRNFSLGKPKRHKGKKFTFEANINRDIKKYGTAFLHIRNDAGDPKFHSDHAIGEDAILGNEAEGGYGQYSGIIAFHPISRAIKKSHDRELHSGHHHHKRDPLHSNIKRSNKK